MLALIGHYTTMPTHEKTNDTFHIPEPCFEQVQVVLSGSAAWAVVAPLVGLADLHGLLGWLANLCLGSCAGIIYAIVTVEKLRSERVAFRFVICPGGDGRNAG